MNWIKIEDQLPPQDGSPFLGYDPKKENQGKIYVIKVDLFRTCIFYTEADGEDWTEWTPTHWMHLPPAPTEMTASLEDEE